MTAASTSTSTSPAAHFDILVVGAGFGGLYALHKLRGLGFSVKVLEASNGVGGTWNWNRYPGARCDVESLEYSYSFSRELEQDWQWSQRYAAQPEILAYIKHVVERFGLQRDIIFDSRVTDASFDDSVNQWVLETDNTGSYTCQFCIMALGCLSVPRQPDFDGIDSFHGDWYHTGFWPHNGVDFSGKRVGVIGTGSSAVQAIPVIATEAAHLSVFQRTANFSIPAHNAPLDAQHQAKWKSQYPALRRAARDTGSGILNMDSDKAGQALSAGERQREIEMRWRDGGLKMWNVFSDVLKSEPTNAVVANFVRERIREVVSDPVVAERLCPKSYPLGSKRLCVDSGYYETFNRENVDLVDVSAAPIAQITPTGLRTSEASFELDVLVFATGFDAMTGPLLNINLKGITNKTLSDKWTAGPRTYLGLAMADFPNLFTVTGPGSPSVLCNMMVAIEQHIDWIADCLNHLRDNDLNRIEATLDAENDWVDHVNEVANSTLYPQANSWYMGANIPGKPRVFMPYVGGANVYRKKCNAVAANRYEGFELRRA